VNQLRKFWRENPWFVGGLNTSVSLFADASTALFFSTLFRGVELLLMQHYIKKSPYKSPDMRTRLGRNEDRNDRAQWGYVRGGGGVIT
jgi:hypothetical protein